MKRPVGLILGAAAAALIVAAVGASAHTGFSLAKLTGVHSAVLNDDASGARTESPEPSESPEASPTAEPSESPEAADNDNEQGDNDDQGENETGAPAAEPSPSGEHDGGSSTGHDD